MTNQTVTTAERFAADGARQATPQSQTMPQNPAARFGRTLVTVATYNEMENLPPLVDAIQAEAPDADILVIDDNSPDGTGTWCDAKGLIDPRIHCLHREGKLGLGTATIAGMRYAIQEGYEFVLNMDADFSHHPRYINAIRELASRNDVDVAIGSRYVPQGGVVGWPFKRHFMSRGVNLYTRLCFGLSTHDCSGAYRCYRTATLKKLNFDSIISRGYSFQEEVLWRLKNVGARFAETPIIFEDRVRGSSKINGQEAVNALKILTRLGIKNWVGI